MKKIFLFIPAFLILTSCGDKKVEDEIVKLETQKDKLSYCIGADQGKMIMESKDPNLNRYNFDLIVEGFEKGFNTKAANDAECEATLKKLFGTQGQDFDTTYLAAGCLCIGKTVGSHFYDRWSKIGAIDKLDLKMAIIGFKHSLLKKDTLVSTNERMNMVKGFVVDLNKMHGAKMLADAKKLPNIQILPSGMIIQTIQAGTGAFPGATDDVKVDYILTSASGDTIQSSFDYKKQSGKDVPAFNLGGQIIAGWKEGFPYLKKGGKYKLFIPTELAYGEAQGSESLCFYIEFHDFGKAGSLLKPEPKNTQERM